MGPSDSDKSAGDTRSGKVRRDQSGLNANLVRGRPQHPPAGDHDLTLTTHVGLPVLDL
jgi:hypothetical protein